MFFFDGIAGVSQVQHGAEGTMSNSVANSTIVGVPENSRLHVQECLKSVLLIHRPRVIRARHECEKIRVTL